MITTNELRIAVFPGDGIGIEVMDACLTILQQLEHHVVGFRLITERLPAGANFYRETGTDITDDAMQKARRLRIAEMTKLIVAGGETSGAVVQTLELKSLRIGNRTRCPMDVHSAADRALSGT